MTNFNTDLTTHSESPYFASNFLPASTVQVHASNLLQFPNGDLLCAWFGGSQEGLSDICIYLSRMSKGSRTWTHPLQISNDPDRSEQNPVLFLNPQTRDLWILYTAQPAGNQDKAVVRYRVSKDEGQSWGDARLLFEDEGLFIRQPMVVLGDGTWVLPAWYCRSPKGYRWVGNDDVSVIKYTHDCGKTWLEKEVPESLGCVHMSVKALAGEGGFVAFFRSRWADNIYTSSSPDCLSWSPPKRTSLPNPNSGICCDVLSSGHFILVYNDSSYQSGQAKREGLYDDITPTDDTRANQPTVDGIGKKEAIWGVPRKALTVAVSRGAGGGGGWGVKKVLQEGEGECLTNDSKGERNKELSYPSIWVERGDGGRDVVNVAFTFWRQRIRFCRFEVEWVES
ncbi:neuraminidase [Lindgomyces ingoldianus]|uniref:Neuraminidase n=1 Tax=Lindgomyces ingoldianus TaxID=673940 RepID=A0ACB6R9G5_9PLEO|nr:neuraminidase [Lindgomyces ingoldianus]KAF2475969.1 neuraminidase [Lindgomyces ingoldianus]